MSCAVLKQAQREARYPNENDPRRKYYPSGEEFLGAILDTLYEIRNELRKPLQGHGRNCGCPRCYGGAE